MVIAREPVVPTLNKADIKRLTEIVFGPVVPIIPCDVIFVFGGINPGHWQTALKAYQDNLGSKIIVTGGRSKTAEPGYQKLIGAQTECEIISRHLIAAGVPKTAIVGENTSTNSLENVLFACSKFDFSTVNKVLFVTKSHVVGRHWRTLKQYLDTGVKLVPASFNCRYDDILVTRNNWMDSMVGRKRVWGEYLRIQTYGNKGDIRKTIN